MMRTDELSQTVDLLGIKLGKAGRQSLKVTKVVRGQSQKGPWGLLTETEATDTSALSYSDQRKPEN